MFQMLVRLIRKMRNIVYNNNSINLNYYIKKADSIINSISANKFSELYSSYILLLSDDVNIIKRVLGAYKKLFNSVNLFKFEEVFRERINHVYNYDYNYWSNFNIRKIIDNIELSASEKINFLGMSSFHPNGYLREKALIALNKFTTGEEIKFIIIRTNDWVNKISKLTTGICLERIKQENIDLIIENALYYIKLSEVNRYNHQAILNKFNNLFNSNTNIKHLLIGIKHEQPKVRKYFFDLLLDLKGTILNLDDLIIILLEEKEPYLKYSTLTNLIIGKLSKEEFIKVYKVFIHEKNSNIRYLILYFLEKYKIENRDKVIYPFIFDMSYSVREYARYLLSKNNYDYHAIYKSELQHTKNIYGCINGLAETGSKVDVQLIIEYLNSKNIKIVKTTLHAVAKLDFDQYKDLILNYLKDDRVGVSKSAYIIISNHIHEYKEGEIYNIYENFTETHVNRYSSQLLTSLSKWKSLKYTLEFLLEEDDYLHKLGNESIQRWIHNFNKTFISPTNQDINVIKNLINKAKFQLTKEQFEFLTFVTKSY